LFTFTYQISIFTFNYIHGSALIHAFIPAGMNKLKCNRDVGMCVCVTIGSK